MKAQIWNFNKWISETNPAVLKRHFETILVESGFHIVECLEHYFTPYGYTALFLLSESHFAIHTFPEESKTYIELSSCNKSYYDRLLNQLEQAGT